MDICLHVESFINVIQQESFQNLSLSLCLSLCDLHPSVLVPLLVGVTCQITLFCCFSSLRLPNYIPLQRIREILFSLAPLSDPLSVQPHSLYSSKCFPFSMALIRFSDQDSPSFPSGANSFSQLIIVSGFT